VFGDGPQANPVVGFTFEKPCGAARRTQTLKANGYFDNGKHLEGAIWSFRTMARIQLSELTAFVAVAEHRSFTKAALQVGIALPTMSQTIRSLEERLGVRLFNRTTRSVAMTEAGERLLAEIQPILEGIDHALESVNSFRDKPMGKLRLTVGRPFAMLLLAPLIKSFLAEYPAVCLEISVDDTHRDIVSGRFDAGIHIGRRVERDMTILRIADGFRMFAVAAPAYLARHPRPSHPNDLHAHDCVAFRSPWDGAKAPWTLSNGDEQIEFAVEGLLIVNDLDLAVSAILDGVGVGYLPDFVVAPHLAQGRLVVVLEDWSSQKEGVFLYHPSRRQTPMPLQVFLRFIEKWRKRAPTAGAPPGASAKSPDREPVDG
jgi:DNA-binding transcriptional LysR family regulator